MFNTIINLLPSVRRARAASIAEETKRKAEQEKRVAMLEEKERILSSPQSTLEFLMKKFRGRPLPDGAILLPRIDLCSPTGPRGPETWVQLDYSRLLRSAVRALGFSPGDIDRIVVGGYGEGLTIFADGRRLFVVGDAFVIGDEPIRGDHSECALCALWICQGLLEREPSRKDELLAPIQSTRTSLVEFTRNKEGEWVMTDYALGW
ncbi:hypothetical protein EOM33_01695 [Candidatus Saccharibacteria bacterium]|nr:hypothetical protein [Candidatus Saccharibacteria bacterium]